MKASFERRLLLHLGAAVVALGLLAAVAQFILAWRELREAQDDMLRQIAALALVRPGHEASALGKVRLGDRDSRLWVAVMPLDRPPGWLRPLPRPGLHTVDAAVGRMRVEVLTSGPYTVIVAQPTDARDELAWNAAARALLPSLLMVPFLIWLISRMVHGEFEPIVRAARRLEARETVDAPDLGIGEMPAEIQPFIDAIEGLLRRTHALMQRQQRFVADAAHELRSPLTALALQARNVRHASSLGEAHARLEALEHGIVRARKLSEQLLGLARMEGAAVEIESVELVDLARELLAEFHPLAEVRRIDLGLDAPAAVRARTSKSLLRTILTNALDNALKFGPAGGDVTLAVHVTDSGVRCEVTDHGPGIPAAERESVFMPFHRLYGGDVAGAGLGLAIAREAAIRISASLSLHGASDAQGLVFRVDIPDRSSAPGGCAQSG